MGDNYHNEHENDQPIQEPPFNPDEDTQPTGAFPQVNETDAGQEAPRWVGGLMLLLAFGLTIGAVVLLVLPQLNQDGEDETIVRETVPTQVPTNTPEAATPTAGPEETPVQNQPDSQSPLPTIDASLRDSLLNTELVSVESGDGPAVRRDVLQPFTIIPERERTEVIVYIAKEGDTIESIANSFGLEPETIAWSNPRGIIEILRPGQEINVPPIDGVYIEETVGSSRTIADWVTQYGVEDVWSVIDSPYNPQLRGFTPDTVPPSGTSIFVPGGEAEDIAWNVNVTIDDGGGGSSGNGGGGQQRTPTINFQPGQPGSCGPQQIVGGAFWSNPMARGSYRITRGFTSYHKGIDLASSVGAPVRAANSGRVVFSGWDNTGYGYMIAIVHGPFLTVYGHLSEYFTNCGQDVSAGQQIGSMGSTGNSSGPHLHFEIRQRQGNTYVPQNPAYTFGF